MESREAGVERLYPKIWGRMSARYYYLIQLRKQLERVIELFVKNSPHQLLADYGCGNKPYEPLFGPFVEQYIGLDLAINTKADVVVDPKGIIEMPDESVGFVLSTQVLEHVEDPTSYLKEACRILQKDGKLILSTHGYWMFHPDPTDFWRWTSAGLQKIVKEAGFEIVYFEGILSRSSMGLQLFQDGLLFKFPKSIRPLWSMLLQPFIIFFDKIAGNKSRREDACTFILVAKKL
ncbi:class I SAM-dependent methyltransferase [Aquirufa aurantiipilula]|uniref:Class I SAM-dependent methyltransferase n=1 Tax=Aquirufa aurantiipilula TaxID=2696561 RepID=A0ABT6BND8_9BACT|nr:class I SAM-dependent methyltransferase [Aquirufa aurantiipilula]MDF5691751.1 class I SAM-dependent methyltransferase [Aquirufa aurantiipilula]